MTETEFFGSVMRTVGDYWPKHKIPPGMQRALYHQCRYYKTSEVATRIRDYARENPDETWPKKLWEYVYAKMKSGDGYVESPRDNYGISAQEKVNIIRGVRESSPHTSSYTDEQVYHEWLGQAGYLRQREMA